MITSGAELRKRRPLQAEVRCPSGAVYLMRRPPLKVWGPLGLPSFFARDVREAWAETSDEERARDGGRTSFEEKEKRNIVWIAFLKYALISPRLVDADPADDEVTIETLAEDFDFLMGWIVAGSPDVPVSTDPEGVQVSDLREFPPEGAGEPALPSGQNGADIRGTAVSTP